MSSVRPMFLTNLLLQQVPMLAKGPELGASQAVLGKEIQINKKPSHPHMAQPSPYAIQKWTMGDERSSSWVLPHPSHVWYTVKHGFPNLATGTFIKRPNLFLLIFCVFLYSYIILQMFSIF